MTGERRAVWELHIVATCVMLVACAGGASSTSTSSSSSSSSGGEPSSGGTSSSAASAANDWSCLPRTVPEPLGPQVVTLVPIATDTPVLGNIEIKACSLADSLCLNPDVTGTTSSLGSVRFDLPVGHSGFRGFLETDQRAYGTQLTMLEPIYIEKEIRFRMWTQVERESYAAAVGVTPDVARGHLRWSLGDCALAPGKDLTATLSTSDGDTVRVHEVSGGPSTTALASTVGAGAFLNAPAGFAVLSIRDNVTSAVVLRADAVIRAGAWTTVETDASLPR